jgi:DNA-binding NtrC family response regulator
MMMPGGMTGSQLAERLRQDEPGLKVIYTSGYSPGMAGKDIAALEGFNFLAKPYPPGKLAQMVRECLDGRLPAKKA